MCCIFTAIYDPENNAYDMFGVQSVKKNLSFIESNTAVPEKSRLIGANRQPRYLCLNHILGQNDCFLLGLLNMSQQCHFPVLNFLVLFMISGLLN